MPCSVRSRIIRRLEQETSLPAHPNVLMRAGYPAAWVKAAEKALKGKKVESLESATPEGITLKPLYCASDLERCEAVADPEQNAPGLFPFHRWAWCAVTATVS